MALSPQKNDKGVDASLWVNDYYPTVKLYLEWQLYKGKAQEKKPKFESGTVPVSGGLMGCAWWRIPCPSLGVTEPPQCLKRCLLVLPYVESVEQGEKVSLVSVALICAEELITQNLYLNAHALTGGGASSRCHRCPRLIYTLREPRDSYSFISRPVKGWQLQ